MTRRHSHAGGSNLPEPVSNKTSEFLDLLTQAYNLFAQSLNLLPDTLIAGSFFARLTYIVQMSLKFLSFSQDGISLFVLTGVLRLLRGDTQMLNLLLHRLHLGIACSPFYLSCDILGFSPNLGGFAMVAFTFGGFGKLSKLGVHLFHLLLHLSLLTTVVQRSLHFFGFSGKTLSLVSFTTFLCLADHTAQPLKIHLGLVKCRLVGLAGMLSNLSGDSLSRFVKFAGLVVVAPALGMLGGFSEFGKLCVHCFHTLIHPAVLDIPFQIALDLFGLGPHAPRFFFCFTCH